jgi:hypothetical protein
MDPMGFLNDMPLTDMFNFVDGGQEISPEDTVSQLLARIKDMD